MRAGATASAPRPGTYSGRTELRSVGRRGAALVSRQGCTKADLSGAGSNGTSWPDCVMLNRWDRWDSTTDRAATAFRRIATSRLAGVVDASRDLARRPARSPDGRRPPSQRPSCRCPSPGTPARFRPTRDAYDHGNPDRFNDASNQRLRSRGGHGIVGFEHSGGTQAALPSVPGGTEQTPAGTWIEKKNRATGAWEAPGYLPPCSGGRGNFYFAVVKAVDADKNVLAKVEIDLGTY